VKGAAETTAPPARAARSRVEGPRVIAMAGAAVGAVVAIVLARDGTGEVGLRAGIRATALTSMLLFVAAFAASSLVRLAPGPRTKWLLRNRRYLGLSMALSHAGHLALIVTVVARDPDFWARIKATTKVGGGLGYVLLAAMVATSTDGAVRRLGRRRWRALHATGMYTLFAIFAFTYAGHIAAAPIYIAPVALLAAALALRLAARLRTR
jgi:sulfoxide reductase heme-binding subunit YedZ